jgi:glycosyltransferase involved in cell wall biosynthesis
MRIAIDARLNAYRTGGIPQYTRQLLTALSAQAPDEQFISLQHREQLRPLVVAPNVARRTLFTPPHHRFEAWSLPIEIVAHRPDVVHFPDFIAPRRRTAPAVVTIHDLAFLHYPEILDDAARAYYGRVRESAQTADAIIAVSEATRQDVAQLLDIPIDQVDVVYEAAAPMFGRIEIRPGEARLLNGAPIAAGSFMLFVSTLEPRKNLPTLLQALRICIDRHPARPYRLVVAGARGWRDDAIFAAARDLRLGEHVQFVGGVGQYDLRWLYNACRMYINPSLYEGFGLPLLEAMACGAPCLAAATSSLPEIGGEAAIYVPPLDAGLWADAIEELWEDEDRRQELGRRGRVQAQRFSWQRAARETLQIYRRTIGDASIPRPLTPPPELLLAEVTAEDLGLRQAPHPAPAAPADRCLRCGGALIDGRLQSAAAIFTQAEGDTHELQLRVRLCSVCGQIDLVAQPEAQQQPVAPESAAAPPETPTAAAAPPPAEAATSDAPEEPAPADAPPAAPRRRERRRATKEALTAASSVNGTASHEPEATGDAPAAPPKRQRRRAAPTAEAAREANGVEGAPAPESPPEPPPAPKRKRRTTS